MLKLTSFVSPIRILERPFLLRFNKIFFHSSIVIVNQLWCQSNIDELTVFISRITIQSQRQISALFLFSYSLLLFCSLLSLSQFSQHSGKRSPAWKSSAVELPVCPSLSAKSQNKKLSKFWVSRDFVKRKIIIAVRSKRRRFDA